MNIFKLLLIPIACLVFLSCEDEPDLVDVEGFNFDLYPVDRGHYVDYEVDSIIIFDLGATQISTKSFLREEIGEPFTSANGEQSFEILRFFKRELNDPWEQINTWQVSFTNSSIDRTEENLRLLNIAFPISRTTVWEATGFLETDLELPYTNLVAEVVAIFDGWTSFYRSIDVPATINGIDFANTTEIVQVDNSNDGNFLESRISSEIYAEGVGLVERRMEIIDTQCQTCCSNGAVVDTAIINSGGGAQVDIGRCSSLKLTQGALSTAEKGFILVQRVIGHN